MAKLFSKVFFPSTLLQITKFSQEPRIYSMLQKSLVQLSFSHKHRREDQLYQTTTFLFHLLPGAFVTTCKHVHVKCFLGTSPSTELLRTFPQRAQCMDPPPAQGKQISLATASGLFLKQFTTLSMLIKENKNIMTRDLFALVLKQEVILKNLPITCCLLH